MIKQEQEEGREARGWGETGRREEYRGTIVRCGGGDRDMEGDSKGVLGRSRELTGVA